MDGDTGTWVQQRAGADVLRVRAIELEVIAVAKTFGARTVVIGRASADLSVLHAELPRAGQRDPSDE